MTRVISMADERARRAGSAAAETERHRILRDQVRADLLDDLSYLGNFGQQALENILDGLPPFGDAA